MIRKKVCMVGAFGVGKTSLVQRFVQGIFSERYLTTVGVKIDQAVVAAPSGSVSVILWDIAGEDGFRSFQANFLNGASGLLFVVDCTRRGTVDVALSLKDRVETLFGRVPGVLVVNKIDLAEQNELTADDLARLRGEFTDLLQTSAKTGSAVEEGFRLLTERMLAAGDVRLQKQE